MKKLLNIFISVVLLLIPINTFAESEKCKIAVIIPLSGQVASLGNYVKKGIDLALEELPIDQKNKLEVIYEDDQFNPVKTISIYRQLKSTKNINAVFVLGSPTANALVPITEADKTLLVAIGASDPTIAVGKEYSFIHWVIPQVLGEKLAAELVRKKFQRIAFVAGEVSGAIADVGAAIEALDKKGKKDSVVYQQNFMKDITDYRSELLKLRQNKADAVVAVLFPGALSSFAKQFSEMKIPAELIGMETFEDEAEVKAANGALLGTWYVNASNSTSDFTKLYQKKYNEYPGWATGNSYDSLKLIASGVKELGFDNHAIRDSLRNLKDYQGAAGIYSASGDNRFTLPASLKRVTEKGFEDYEP